MENIMKLGIMQPYFFPYIGYFDLIYQTEQWVVFDTVQFIRHGWINRNRILHPHEGWQYIIVPARKHEQQTTIKDIRITEDKKWVDKLLGQLQHYKKKAPYFDTAIDLVNDCLCSPDESLSILNVKCLEKVCIFLGIPFHYSFFSEMDLKLDSVNEPGDWALRISEAIGASEYINPPGGIGLFDHKKFESSSIKLTIQEPSNFTYSCDDYYYQPNLSIIDVIMWNSQEDILAYLASRSQ
jgi:hypothetical protein